MEAIGLIHEATLKCRRSFTACLEVETLTKDEWAENRLADFNLWISGTGAEAAKRASLDSRLAHRPEVRDVVANILNLLAGVVDDCRKLG